MCKIQWHLVFADCNPSGSPLPSLNEEETTVTMNSKMLYRGPVFCLSVLRDRNMPIHHGGLHGRGSVVK